MGNLYKEQHHGNLIQGSALWENYATISIMGTLYRMSNIMEHYTRTNIKGELCKKQHHGELIQAAAYGKNK